jgi:hypothetical protein
MRFARLKNLMPSRQPAAAPRVARRFSPLVVSLLLMPMAIAFLVTPAPVAAKTCFMPDCGLYQGGIGDDETCGRAALAAYPIEADTAAICRGLTAGSLSGCCPSPLTICGDGAQCFKVPDDGICTNGTAKLSNCTSSPTRQVPSAAAPAAPAEAAAPAIGPSGLPYLVPPCARSSGGLPGFDCAMTLGENIIRIILGGIGAIVLLMFVYGGFMVITSSGSGDKGKQGMTIIRNALIGLVIVLIAGYVVEYFLARLGSSSPGTTCSDGAGRPGKYVDVGGEQRCISACAGISEYGYSCIDTKQHPEAQGCITLLCRDNPDPNVLCCLPGQGNETE